MKSTKYSTEFLLFSTIFQATGLFPHSRQTPFNYLLSFYTVLILLGIASLFTFGLFINSVIGSRNSLSEMVETLVFVGVMVTHVITVLQAWVSRDEQFQIYEKFDEIDELFQSHLHHSIDHARAKEKIYKKIGYVLLLLLAFQCAYYAFNFNHSSIRYCMTLTFSMMSLRLRGIQNLFYIDSMDLKLRLLCDTLEVAITHGNDRKSLQKSDKLGGIGHLNEYHDLKKMSVFDQLVVMKQIYGRIWDVANLINDCFGWSLLALVTQNFIELTCSGYWLFLALDGQVPTNTAYISICYITPVILLLFLIAYACHVCAESASDINNLIHQVEKDLKNDLNNAMVREFALQIIHEPIVISANGFFNLDFALIGSIGAATITYLVILIQFQQTEVASEVKTQ